MHGHTHTHTDTRKFTISAHLHMTNDLQSSSYRYNAEILQTAAPKDKVLKLIRAAGGFAFVVGVEQSLAYFLQRIKQ